MAVIRIGDKAFEVEGFKAVEGKKPPPPKSPTYDQPFFDEICIKLDKPMSGGPRYFVARLMGKTDLAAIKNGVEITIPPRNALQAPVTGKVVWVNDEKPSDEYEVAAINFELGFMAETESGPKLVKAKPEDYGTTAEALKRDVLKKIGLKPGDKITAAKWGALVRQLPKLAELFPGQIFQPYPPQVTWNGEGQLEIGLLVSPPPKNVTINFLNPPEAEMTPLGPVVIKGEPIPADKVKGLLRDLKAKIRDFFSPPFSRARIEEGMQKYADFLAERGDFWLASGIRPVYSESGDLILETSLAPAPTGLQVRRRVVNESGKEVEVEKILTGLLLPVPVPRQLTLKNIGHHDEQGEYVPGEYVKELLKAYERDGFWADAELGELDNGVQTIEITLSPPLPGPLLTDFHGFSRGAPSTKKLQEMFDPEGRGFYTRTSLEEGVKKFKEWCREKGYLLFDNGPPIKLEGRVPHLTAHVAAFAGFEVVYVEGDGTRSKLYLHHGNRRPEVDEPGELERILNHFRQKNPRAKEPEALNVNDLREALAEIYQTYPVRRPERVEESYDITRGALGNPDYVHVRVTLYDNSFKTPIIDDLIGGTAFPRIRVSPQVGVTFLEGHDTQFNAGLGLGRTAKDGTDLSLNVGGTTDGTNSVVDAQAAWHDPWFTKGGTSATVGVAGSAGVEGDFYPHNVSPFIEGDIPRTNPFDPWGYIVGGNVSFTWGGPLDQLHAWAHGYGGVRYRDRDWKFRATAGPFVGLDGDVYAQIDASGERAVRLGERSAILLNAAGGAQIGSPEAREFTGAQVPPGHGAVTAARRSPIYLKAGGSYRYRVTDGESSVELGWGAGVAYLDGFFPATGPDICAYGACAAVDLFTPNGFEPSVFVTKAFRW